MARQPETHYIPKDSDGTKTACGLPAQGRYLTETSIRDVSCKNCWAAYKRNESSREDRKNWGIRTYDELGKG